MKSYVLTACIALLAFSCEKKSTEIVNTDNSLNDTIVIPETNEPIESSTLQTCYMEAINKDSVFISLDDNLGTITGKLRYKNFEKDSSYGDLMGSQNGDTLKLMYTFESEGSTSEREIYFLRKDGNLLEATGEYKVDGIKSIYANPNALKYDAHVLKQADCNNFEKNFKIK